MRSGSYLKIYSDGIPFVRFCLVASGLHLTFALPILVIILLFHLTDMITAFFLITLFLLSSPILSWLCWLMAKGSNWVNTAAAIKTAGGVSGQLYGALVGELLGAHFFGTVGAIILAVLCLVFGMFAGVALGGYAANKLADRIQDITIVKGI